MERYYRPLAVIMIWFLYYNFFQLFQGYSFSLQPGFDIPLKNEITTLLETTGASIIRRRPSWKALYAHPTSDIDPSQPPSSDYPMLIVHEVSMDDKQMAHLRKTQAVSEVWVFNCISTLSVLPISNDPLSKRIHSEVNE